MDWDLYGFVLAGELRQKIVKLLDEPKTPTQLKNIIKTQDSAIARCLTVLIKKNIVAVINPESRKGKLCALTKEGKEIRDKLS